MDLKDSTVGTDITESVVKLSDKHLDAILGNDVDIPEFLQAYKRYHRDIILTSTQLLNLYRNYIVLTTDSQRAPAYYKLTPDEFFSRIPPVRIAYFASNLK